MICYDISRRETFDGLDAWLSDARTLASPELCVVLVGNMLDVRAPASLFPLRLRQGC